MGQAFWGDAPMVSPGSSVASMAGSERSMLSGSRVGARMGDDPSTASAAMGSVFSGSRVGSRMGDDPSAVSVAERVREVERSILASSMASASGSSRSTMVPDGLGIPMMFSTPGSGIELVFDDDEVSLLEGGAGVYHPPVLGRDREDVKNQFKMSSKDKKRLLNEIQTANSVARKQSGLGDANAQRERAAGLIAGRKAKDKDGVVQTIDLGIDLSGFAGPDLEIRQQAMAVMLRADDNHNGMADSLESVVVGAGPSTEEVTEMLRADPNNDGVGGDVLGAAMQAGLGLGVTPQQGGFAMDVDASTDQAPDPTQMLTDEERATLEANYMHPLRDPFVTNLPPLEKDDDKSLYCFKDCIEREKGRLKECDEVRRRVISQLKVLGCHSLAVPIKTNTACGMAAEASDDGNL